MELDLLVYGSGIIFDKKLDAGVLKNVHLICFGSAIVVFCVQLQNNIYE
jgi:hypothetical protein